MKAFITNTLKRKVRKVVLEHFYLWFLTVYYNFIAQSISYGFIHFVTMFIKFIQFLYISRLLHRQVFAVGMMHRQKQQIG